MSNSNEPRQILLSPESTVFIIIDHQTAFERCFSAESVAIAENGVAELVGVAGAIDVPIITSLVETNQIGSQLSSTLEAKIPHLTRLIRSSVDPWDDPAFAQAVQAINRPCLLIAGLSAEISLSFTALSALARGVMFSLLRMPA